MTSQGLFLGRYPLRTSLTMVLRGGDYALVAQEVARAKTSSEQRGERCAELKNHVFTGGEATFLRQLAHQRAQHRTTEADELESHPMSKRAKVGVEKTDELTVVELGRCMDDVQVGKQMEEEETQPMPGRTAETQADEVYPETHGLVDVFGDSPERKEDPVLEDSQQA